MFDKQLAYLGSGVYLGNWESCKALPDIPAIHICDTKPSLCGVTTLLWVESEKLTTAQIQFAEGIIKSHDEIVIHCQAGMNRSCTIAFLALLLRGVEYREAYLAISRAVMYEYVIPIIPAWKYENLRSIMVYCGLKK